MPTERTVFQVGFQVTDLPGASCCTGIDAPQAAQSLVDQIESLPEVILRLTASGSSASLHDTDPPLVMVTVKVSVAPIFGLLSPAIASFSGAVEQSTGPLGVALAVLDVALGVADADPLVEALAEALVDALSEGLADGLDEGLSEGVGVADALARAGSTSRLAAFCGVAATVPLSDEPPKRLLMTHHSSHRATSAPMTSATRRIQ